jgi:guanyl-specific ribonuclease Sa
MSKGKKRINPETGKPFKYGDNRHDGFIFSNYQSVINKNGYMRELWLSPKSFEKEKKRKEEYSKTDQAKESTSRRQKERRKKYKKLLDEKQLVLTKRINTDTGIFYKAGERRSKTEKQDGMIFRGYDKHQPHNNNSNYYKENWVSVEAFEQQYWYKSARRTKERAKIKGIPNNIDAEYLKSIFPKDFLCPVLGVKMKIAEGFGSGIKESPSLDRVIPEKGYVRGNVIWISLLANQIKTSATPDEIEKVYKWLKKEYNKRGLE